MLVTIQDVFWTINDFSELTRLESENLLTVAELHARISIGILTFLPQSPREMKTLWTYHNSRIPHAHNVSERKDGFHLPCIITAHRGEV